MVRDLQRRHSLVGKSKSDVLALLGPPTPTDKWGNYDIVYVLGPDLIDYYWLLIRLDEQGIVAHLEVRPD